MMGYTTAELLAIAHAERLSVTQRNFYEWQRAGFLPQPARVRTPGQGRGRPQFTFPDPAPRALCWLARHRRFIEGDDAVRYWLWLEGFDYAVVDLNAVLLAALERQWSEVQANLPGLYTWQAALDGARLDDDQQESMRDTFDQRVMVPALRQGFINSRHYQLVLSVLALMGALPPDEASLDSITDHADTRAAFPHAIRAVRLPAIGNAAKRETIDWQVIRATWQLFTPDLLTLTIDKLMMLPFVVRRQRGKHSTSMVEVGRYDPLTPVVVTQCLNAMLSSMPPQTAEHLVAHPA